MLRKHVVKRDWKLATPGNNGRKVLVTRIREHRERPAEDPEWVPEPDAEGRTPLLETGAGGLEVATCNELAAQDRHRHLESTEIYTVLEGRLAIYLNDEGPVELGEGDEVVILPETVHQVAALGPVLVRVHAVDSGGESDKYVQLEKGGEWRRWSELGPEERAGAYRMPERQ